MMMMITFMQGIYSNTPEANHVYRVCNVTAVLYLQFSNTCNVISPVECVLYLYLSTSRSMCAVHSMAVFVFP